MFFFIAAVVGNLGILHGTCYVTGMKNKMETALFLFSVGKLLSRLFSSTSVFYKREQVLWNAASVQSLQVFKIS